MLRRAEAAVRVLANERGVSEATKSKANGILKEMADLEKHLKAERVAIKELADELTKNRHLAGIIRRRIDEFAERAEAFAEMVATGLSAQAAAHDVPALLQQIDGAAMLFNKAGRSGFVDPRDAVKHSETIMAANTGVKQMLDLLQPMLRGRRFAKRTAKVSELVAEYFNLRGPRLKTRGILWEVVGDVASDFSVTINPGRLTQVLDNLVTNSEYWLEDHWGRGSKEGRIKIEIAKPKLIYSDNGPGVHPNVEASLFELFVSGKPAGQGNGLGLFITRQLLERDNCTIFLDEERNRNERRYRFNINLSDVRSDKS
jgi:signal transduction histidine kinase